MKSVRKTLEQLAEDIYENYCKYRDTSDEECVCDIIRNGGSCPLDVLF